MKAEELLKLPHKELNAHQLREKVFILSEMMRRDERLSWEIWEMVEKSVKRGYWFPEIVTIEDFKDYEKEDVLNPIEHHNGEELRNEH